MEYFLDSFFADPLFYIGVFFSFVAALGFLIYLRGVIAGIGYTFTLSGHAEHVQTAYTRVVWGLLILTATFVVWEIVRWLAGIF